MANDHHGPLFSKISSCPEKELLGKAIVIPDDEETAAARAKAELEPTAENLLLLAKCLSFQQRHRESAVICRRVTKMEPENYAAHRRLGLNLMKTLQHEEATREFFRCLERSEDQLDIHYRLGLCFFYQGQYEQAWYWFISCFPLSRDRGEMYVATLYWSILCLRKQGRSDWDDYVKPVDPGHHIGYDLFVRYATGKMTREELDRKIPEVDVLSRTCITYAMYVWFEKTEPALAARYMEQMIACSELWGSFSFLGGYTEYLRLKNKNQNE